MAAYELNLGMNTHSCYEIIQNCYWQFASTAFPEPNLSMVSEKLDEFSFFFHIRKKPLT